jgi:hypothetical protein
MYFIAKNISIQHTGRRETLFLTLNEKHGLWLSENKILKHIFRPSRSGVNSVSVVSDYGLDDRGSIPDRGRGFFLLSLRPDQL